MNKDKILSLLGLAFRAQKVLLGEGLVLNQVKHYPNSILFIASDAGQNITKKIQDKAMTYHITLIDLFTSDELSQAFGKHRKLVLVTDKGFITRFLEYINS